MRLYPLMRVIAKTAVLAALGAATTVSVAWASAIGIPMETSGGVVARDGDHLGPWVIQVRAPTAVRTIWFEKGRIYGKTGVGPANGSSAAVACWSFATSTRTNPKFKRVSVNELDVPQDLRQLMEDPSVPVWGVAQDVRGWPMPAMGCLIRGTMDRAAPDPYAVNDGVRLRQGASWAGRFENLASVRALPLRPHWGGVVVNTLAGAVAWWGVLAAA